MIVVVWLGAPLGAQGPLSLEGAMKRARAGAFAAEAARSEALARAADAERARAERWPRLRVAEILTRTDAPADAFGLTLMQERFSFPDFVAGDPNNPGTVRDALTRFELELPVFTGGELSARISQATAAAEAAALIADRSDDLAAAEAAKAWVDLAEAREGVLILERALETVRAHVRLARAHVEAGTLVASELLRAEVEEARVADMVAEARGMAAVAEANLIFRLGGDQSVRGAELADMPTPGPLPVDRDDLAEAATTRADLEAFRRGRVARELELDVAAAMRRPKVGLLVRHDLHDRDPFGADGRSTTVVLAASVDLFDGGRARAARTAAEGALTATTAQLAEAEHGARLEAEAAWARAAAARERRETAELALAAARETERILEARFEQGVVRTLDVLDASAARREAEGRELSARAAAWRSSFELMTALGRAPELLFDSPASPNLGASR
jgi:outer membrane protein TolC